MLKPIQNSLSFVERLWREDPRPNHIAHNWHCRCKWALQMKHLVRLGAIGMHRDRQRCVLNGMCFKGG